MSTQDQAHIYKVRKKNTLFLLKQRKVDRHQLCELTGMGYSLLSGYLRPNNPKNIGNITAEKIEKAFDLKPGDLDRDLTKEAVDEKPITPPMPETDHQHTKIHFNQILEVPLFISEIDIGSFDPNKEPYIEKAFIALSNVVHRQINPLSVKAIFIKEHKGFAPNTIAYMDTESLSPEDDHLYLVAWNGKRTCLGADELGDKNISKILGRIFHVEHPVE